MMIIYDYLGVSRFNKAPRQNGWELCFRTNCWGMPPTKSGMGHGTCCWNNPASNMKHPLNCPNGMWNFLLNHGWNCTVDWSVVFVSIALQYQDTLDLFCCFCLLGLLWIYFWAMHGVLLCCRDFVLWVIAACFSSVGLLYVVVGCFLLEMLECEVWSGALVLFCCCCV